VRGAGKAEPFRKAGGEALSKSSLLANLGNNLLNSSTSLVTDLLLKTVILSPFLGRRTSAFTGWEAERTTGSFTPTKASGFRMTGPENVALIWTTLK